MHWFIASLEGKMRGILWQNNGFVLCHVELGTDMNQTEHCKNETKNSRKLFARCCRSVTNGDQFSIQLDDPVADAGVSQRALHLRDGVAATLPVYALGTGHLRVPDTQVRAAAEVTDPRANMWKLDDENILV